LLSQLESAGQKLETVQRQISVRDRGADASRVVLWGEPNSGKSSLFNSLLGTQQSIVTEVAGTTTDFVVGVLVLKSMKLDLVDTAGAEERSEYVSSQAQQHRIEQQEQADARLFCIDSLREPTPWEKEQLSHLTTACVVVLTKIDLHSPDSKRLTKLTHQIRASGFDGPVVATSSQSGDGLDQLGDEISLAIINSQSADQSIVGTTVLRASESLRDASAAVGHAKDAVENELGDELVASEIRRSLEALGQVVGAIYTDDILDLVFGRFCIGK
jgi:tRNA modification GTPase